MEKIIKDLREQRRRLLSGGGSTQIEKQHGRGKLTARERLDLLIDPGTFYEIDLWSATRKTGFDIDQRELPGDGVVTGSGEVEGRTVYLYAQDFTVMGGTMGSVHARKIIN